jgi:hypothetical protein
VVIHPSYDEAKAAVDGAIDLVRSKGATVLRALPVRERGGWRIRVDTANQLPSDTREELAVEGIGITIYSADVGHRQFSRKIASLRGK